MTLSVSNVVVDELWPTLLYNVTAAHAFIYNLPQVFNQVEVWSPMAEEQAQIVATPPPCFTVGIIQVHYSCSFSNL